MGGWLTVTGVREGDPSSAGAAKAQAGSMIQMYADALTRDETSLLRMRQLMVTQSDDTDRERTMTDLRPILIQLENVGRRAAFWNDRLCDLSTRSF